MSAGETMVICQICEHENEADQRFCDECGAELQPSEQPGTPVPNNAPTLDETSDLETSDGLPVKIERLLSLGRLNRYACSIEGHGGLLLEETPTAPGILAQRKELLSPLLDLEEIWQPIHHFEHNDRHFACRTLPTTSTLHEQVSSNGPLGAEELKNLGSQLAKMLTELHKRDFLIRSLQPDRLWWDSESGSLVVDTFERLVPQDSSDGEFQVVNGFSAPEAYGVGEGGVGIRSDLYTAGAILHFAASGQRTDLESREQFFAFDPLTELDDPILVACVAGLTAKNPDHRISSGEEFSKALEEKFASAVPSAPIVATGSPVAAGAAPLSDSDSPILTNGCQYQVALQSHVGCVRTINQDACLQMRFTAIEKSQPRQANLVVIVDGMGGEAEGDKAASIALRTVAKEVLNASLSLKDERVTAPLLPAGAQERNSLVLENALKRANTNIFEYAERHPHRRGMGCTVTACILEPNEVTLGHVGDTRAYHLRGSEMTRITTDHSLVGRLVEMGQLTEEEARNSPQRPVIYRAMGTNPEVDVDIYHQELQPGDRLMVSSDGVWEYFESGELNTILQQDESPDVIANQLVNICLQRGADDNATLAVIFCK